MTDTTTTTIVNPRQTTLKEIAQELKAFDFKAFDVINDKTQLLIQLESIKDARAKKNMSKVNLEDLKEYIKCLN